MTNSPHDATIPPYPQDDLSERDVQRFIDLSAERARRQLEALKLYEPQEMQEEFHASKASERVVRGGNRSGKSICTFVEVARAATCQDPHKKYPTNRPLIIWVVGFDEKHIGKTIHRLLFRAGAFMMIRDEETNRWRAFRRYDPKDRAREDEAKPAPPLIPPRYIAEIAWEDRAKRIFSVVRLKNGTEIYAFSSRGEAPQGDPADLIHIDEDIMYPEWIPEMEARLSDLKGRLTWSAFPHNQNDALVDMSNRAADDVGNLDPDVEEFLLTFSGNPHIDPEEKRKRIKGWSEEERRARDLGEFLTDSVLMYPKFHIGVHGCPRKVSEDGPDIATNYVTAFDYELRLRHVPANWTRYMIVDPGHTRCAVLFLAVPPPIFGDFVLAYDELYMAQCDPAMFGRNVDAKVRGQGFYDFIIDMHGGRLGKIASGRNVRQQYTAELQKRRIGCERRGFHFANGSDDRAARSMAVRSWLDTRDDGTTKFRVLCNLNGDPTCPNLVKEFGRYRKHIVKEETKDVADPNSRWSHLMHCLEYGAAYNPQYHEVNPRANYVDPVRAEYERWLKASSKFKDGPEGGAGAVFGVGTGRN